MTYDVIARARRSTIRRVAAACLAAAAATMFAVAAGLYLTGRDQPASSAPTVPVPAASRSWPTGGDSGVGGAMVLPADLRWVEVAGVSLPVSSQSGPRDSGGGLARGFAHDQAGAVLAAVHIVVRVAPQVGVSVFDPTLRTQVVGPDAAAMRSQVAHDYEALRDQARVAYGQPVGRLYATLRGYRFIEYSAEDVTVSLLTESTDAQGNRVLTAAEVQVRWTGSDWALVVPAFGTFNATVSVLTDPSGYLLFNAGR